MLKAGLAENTERARRVRDPHDAYNINGRWLGGDDRVTLAVERSMSHIAQLTYVWKPVVYTQHARARAYI